MSSAAVGALRQCEGKTQTAEYQVKLLDILDTFDRNTRGTYAYKYSVSGNCDHTQLQRYSCLLLGSDISCKVIWYQLFFY